MKILDVGPYWRSEFERIYVIASNKARLAEMQSKDDSVDVVQKTSRGRLAIARLPGEGREHGLQSGDVGGLHQMVVES